MEQVLLVVQVIVTLALIIMVLIQRSDSDGFGLSGGSGNNLLSGRSTANLMTRSTAILAAVFMANALLLGVLAARGQNSSIVEAIEEQQADIPSVPVAGETKADKKSEKKAADKTAPSVPEADAKPAEDNKKTIKKVKEKIEEIDPNATTQSNE